MTESHFETVEVPHFDEAVIPEEVLNAFFTFLNGNNKTTKTYFDINDATGEKIPVREVEEVRPNDLKATLSLFEKMYPQYFDKLTQERILKAQKESGNNEADDFAETARKVFSMESDIDRGAPTKPKKD